MISIFSKRLEIEEQKRNMTGLQYSARNSLKLREWDVLTTVCALLRDSKQETPEYAIEGESPDFMTYRENGTLAFPVEITEVLHPSYRRGEFWRKNEAPDAPKILSPLEELSDPWLPLRLSISSKSKKPYLPGTQLFIYHDISRISFADWGTPFDKQVINEHSQNPFSDLDSFSRILVLWADMKSLTELHPIPSIIVPDTNV